MQKAVFNKTGTRQIINSDYKLFNNQTNYISTGNVIANTQFSSYIRPYNETKCNGVNFLPGELMKYDLQNFNDLPHAITEFLSDKSRTESYILYMFFINRKRSQDIIGYIITDSNHKYIRLACRGNPSTWAKRESALQECIKYICE